MRILGDFHTNLPREIRKKADYFKLNPVGLCGRDRTKPAVIRSVSCGLFDVGYFTKMLSKFWKWYPKIQKISTKNRLKAGSDFVARLLARKVETNSLKFLRPSTWRSHPDFTTS
jgi:hypothetical protein